MTDSPKTRRDRYEKKLKEAGMTYTRFRLPQKTLDELKKIRDALGQKNLGDTVSFLVNQQKGDL